jgi:uncharacterized protein (TIGR02266 family)
MPESKPVEEPVEGQRRARAEAQITELGETDHEARREAPRFSVDLDVSLGSDHNFYSGFAENISSGGVFVATHMLKPVGEILELGIYFADNEQSIRVMGEVRWVRVYNESSDVPPGMGIRFIELERGAQDIIETFLKKRDPLFFDDE